MTTLHVGLVEDDPSTRASLVVLLNGTPGFHCPGAFATGAAALEGIPALKPDVVLVDYRLPDVSGVEVIRRLKLARPEIQYLMWTVFEDDDVVFQSLVAGASGYLLKRTAPAQLIEAITDVHRGGSPMSSQIARKVVRSFQHDFPRPGAAAGLSTREHEILGQLARGLQYKEIAAALGISLDTVRSHLRNVYEKLQVRSRTEAVVKFLARRPGASSPDATPPHPKM